MERFYRENAATEDSASLSDDEDLSSDEWSEEEDEDDESRPKRVAWTLEEDRKLTQLVHTDGANNWSSKATRLGTGRSGGAVNIRWNRLQRKAAVSASPPEKQQEVEPTILSLAWKAEKDDDSDATEEEDEAIARSAANAEHPTVTVGTWKDAAEALVATRRAKGAASSPYIGVSWHKTGRVWRAQISESSKLNTLGSFSSEEEAARAYDARARALRGTAARGGSGGGGRKLHALNFPTELEQGHRQSIDLPPFV
jgi:hypothetical protein